MHLPDPQKWWLQGKFRTMVKGGMEKEERGGNLGSVCVCVCVCVCLCD